MSIDLIRLEDTVKKYLRLDQAIRKPSFPWINLPWFDLNYHLLISGEQLNQDKFPLQHSISNQRGSIGTKFSSFGRKLMWQFFLAATREVRAREKFKSDNLNYFSSEF